PHPPPSHPPLPTRRSPDLLTLPIIPDRPSPLRSLEPIFNPAGPLSAPQAKKSPPPPGKPEAAGKIRQSIFVFWALNVYFAVLMADRKSTRLNSSHVSSSYA